MSRVRNQGGSTTTTTQTQTARRAPYPAPPQRAAASASGSSSVAFNSRRVAAPESSNYRVEHIVGKNGIGMEVITIEDTPEPAQRGAGPSAGTSASAYASSSRSYGPAHPEPAHKKRRSDAAYTSEQPNGDNQAAAYSSRATNGSYATTTYSNGNASKSTGSGRNKRKHDAYEGYSNGRDSASSRDSAQRPAQRAKEKEQPVNDKEGHFIVRVGDKVGDKYTIRRPLGQGTFGKVVCAVDRNTGKEVAIKVIRAVPKYREASKVEVKVLQLIKTRDSINEFKCIHLLETFDHKNHVCLVTELLSASVFDFLKENSYQPFPLFQIQSFAKQLFKSVQFLHGMKLIHTDLKPENILLESVASHESVIDPSSKKPKAKKILKRTDIRLIDFGSATFEHEYHATVVSTRHYRAPEIILGTGWSYECDVWSIGCILIEFFTGEALFQTHENVEHLAMMERVFGPMPPDFMQKAYTAISPNHPDWFVVEKKRPVKLNFPVTTASSAAGAQAVTSKQSIKFVKQMKELKSIVRPDANIGTARFLNLLSRLLVWEPSERLTVKDALQHPFFNMTISPDL